MPTISDTGCPAPTIIPRPEHNVSRASISRNALKVLYRLHNNGHQAFLVGGGVRDLLLGREPKDFDIATDARPDEMRKLFRNCRLIGRRFRLAHVHFGPEVIEVATFRAAGEDQDDDTDSDAEESAAVRVVDDNGRILRDNVYGTIDEDVWRRDFTANALYYNIADYSIWDYVDGVPDIQAGTLRVLGDPVQRYLEDPVRMLRAVRFAAKLGFRMDPQSEAPLRELGPQLQNVPPARLLDEVLKMFLGGFAVETFELLRHYDLFGYLFPATNSLLDDAEADAFRVLVTHGLANSDRRVAEDKPVTPVFLFAVLLWEPVRRLALQIEAEGEKPAQALRFATLDIAREQQSQISIPKRFVQGMVDMLTLQPRFEQRQSRRAQRLLEHPRFRAAYDFLLLRAEAGEVSTELAEWWTQLQELAPAQRGEVLDKAPAPRRRRRGGRRRGARHRRGGVGETT